MKKINLGGTNLEVPSIAVGCMRIWEMELADVAKLMDTALQAGVNFFDHADIYGGGKSEEVFAGAMGMTPKLREKIIIQTKCGIRNGMYDFTAEHIISSAEASLKRLKTEYIDVFLLHRPDSLMEPEEVALAFDKLENAGKVRHFGVSNQNPMQIELLKTAVKQKIVANQLQFSIAHSGLVDTGFNVNMRNEASIDRCGGALEYCRIHNITIQAWSPLQYGFFEGVFVNDEKFPKLNAVLDRIANEQSSDNSSVAIAWILRHPANMQVVTGTTNPERLQKMISANDVELSREEWYEIYRSIGNVLP